MSERRRATAWALLGTGRACRRPASGRRTLAGASNLGVTDGLTDGRALRANAIRKATLHFDLSDDTCWYLDDTFCTLFHDPPTNETDLDANGLPKRSMPVTQLVPIVVYCFWGAVFIAVILPIVFHSLLIVVRL